MKRNFGTSVWMVLHVLRDISTFGYNGSQIVVVVERQCSKQAENHQTLITNRLQETLVLAQKTENILGSIPIDLEKWPLYYLTFLTPSLHHPASLYKEGGIYEEEIIRYSFRAEVQPGSHRLAGLWRFASKSNTHLLCTVHVSNME